MVNHHQLNLRAVRITPHKEFRPHMHSEGSSQNYLIASKFKWATFILFHMVSNLIMKIIFNIISAPTPAPPGVCGLRPVSPRVSRIFGGKSAVYGAFPWQASVLKRDQFNIYKHSCGGTILNDKWILSAAHCYV